MASKTKVGLVPEQRLELEELIERINLHLSLKNAGIFIIGTDSLRTQKIIERELKSGLKDIAWYPLDSSQDTDPLLKIWELMKRKAIDPSQAVFSLDIRDLKNSQMRRTLNAINIRREYIPEGHFIFLLWGSIQQIDDIPKYAKDFWSFRTSTHKFEAKPFRRKGRVKGLENLRNQIQETKEFIKKVERKEHPKNSLLASLYFKLGEQAYKASDLELSLEAWEKAKRLYQKIGDERNLSATLGNIGLIYQDKGDLDEALKYYKEALKIHREIGYLQGVGNWLANIGLIYQAKGDLDEALKYYKEALKIFREIGYFQGIITVLGNIENVYNIIGEKEKAEEISKELERLKSKNREVKDLLLPF